MSKGGGKDSSVISPQLADIRAKSFLHALSEIEQFSAVEYRTDLPEGVVPMQPKFSFFDIAGKTAMITTFYTFIMSPFSFAVTEKILPVFGNINPSFIDKLFSYLLAAAPTLAMTLLIMFVLTSKVYVGKTTRIIVENFLLSFVGVKLVISFILSMIILMVYNNFLSDQNIVRFYTNIINDTYLPNFIKKLSYHFLKWFIDFKEVIPTATKFSVFLHAGTAFALFLSYQYAKNKSERIKKFRQEWE